MLAPQARRAKLHGAVGGQARVVDAPAGQLPRVERHGRVQGERHGDGAAGGASCQSGQSLPAEGAARLREVAKRTADDPTADGGGQGEQRRGGGLRHKTTGQRGWEGPARAIDLDAEQQWHRVRRQVTDAVEQGLHRQAPEVEGPQSGTLELRGDGMAAGAVDSRRPVDEREAGRLWSQMPGRGDDRRQVALDDDDRRRGQERQHVSGWWPH